VTRQRLVLGVLLGLAVAGCGGPTPPGPTPTPELEPTTYTLCPASGELPAVEENDAAIRVVGARLDAMGVAGKVSIGTCLDVSIEGVAGDDALRAVLFGSGLVEVVAVPPDRAAAVQPGEPPPDDLAVVLDGTMGDIAGAAADAGAVEIRLSDAAASRVSTWTTTHPGEALALVLDGGVVGTLPIDGSIGGGVLRVPVGEVSGLTPAAVAALLAAGPLPGDWRQPDAPQG